MWIGFLSGVAEWAMALVFALDADAKTVYQKAVCIQNMTTIPGSIANMIGGTYMTI